MLLLLPLPSERHARKRSSTFFMNWLARRERGREERRRGSFSNFLLFSRDRDGERCANPAPPTAVCNMQKKTDSALKKKKKERERETTFFFLQVFKFPPLSLSTSRPLSLSLSALSLSLRSLSLSSPSTKILPLRRVSSTAVKQPLFIRVRKKKQVLFP